MAHSRYHHFPSRAKERAEAVILPARGHNRMRCFTDQVKLTHALVRDLDEAIKEVKLLGEHEEESSQKITELEVLCKKLREDTQRLEEKNATLEGMVESCDKLLMEITRETGLDHMGEDEDDEEEEEDADDGGDAIAPPAIAPPPPAPPAVMPDKIDEEGSVEVIPEQEALMLHVTPRDSNPHDYVNHMFKRP
jgi:DNA-binding transcriptional MerR regulator